MAPAEATAKPLGGKAYGHIPHLPGSRLGPGDHHCHEGQARICLEKARDRHDVIIVQEKLDGSCVSVARVNGQIEALIRAGYRAVDSPRRQHQMFASWVLHNVRRFADLLGEGERVCGEWLAQAHGTRYSLTHEPLVPFDIMRGTERSPALAVEERCRQVDLIPPRIIHAGGPLPLHEIVALLDPSAHGALDPVEGAVWRVERKGKVDFLAKYVRPEKKDGAYFDQGEVWNSWPGCERYLP